MKTAMLVLAAAISPLLAQPTTNPSATPSTTWPPKPSPRKVAGRIDPAYWWNDVVFYEVFVRSFADSTQGPLAGDGIGDLQGLIEKLDYLNDGNPETATDLGVGGIWLMPIMPAPSYHGYDVTDYYGINPQYGTIDDFKRLMAECRRRGIKVIIDLVMNHCSHKHEWFTKAADPASPMRDWFIWSDKDPGWKGPWNQRMWHRLPPAGPTAAESYYYGLFSPTMPDFNFRNVQVGEVFKAVCFAWLSNYGVDGFRLDAIRHLIEEGQVQENTAATHAWLKGWYLETKGVNLEAMTIGEVWSGSEQASSYVGKGMDLVFEFALADAMIASVKAGTKDAVAAAQKKVLELYPANQYGRFLSNHDQTRVMTQLKGDAAAMRAAAALLLLGPGVPFIYYGEEIGMTGDKPDEMLRTPMQWTKEGGFTTGKAWAAMNAGFETLNVEAQAGDPESLLNWYRTLIGLRNRNRALASGGMWMVETDRPEVVAFMRHRVVHHTFGDPDPKARGGGGEKRPAIYTALVVVNLSDRAVDSVSLSLESGPWPGKIEMTDALGAGPVTIETDDRGGFRGLTLRDVPARGVRVYSDR